MVKGQRNPRQRKPQPPARLAVGMLLVALVAPPSLGPVLCRGVDGHVAMETRVQPGCCPTPPLSGGEEASAPSPGGCAGCVDTLFPRPAGKAERYPTAQSSLIAGAVAHDAALSPAAPTTAGAVPASLLATSPTVRALRAVVLLI